MWKGYVGLSHRLDMVTWDCLRLPSVVCREAEREEGNVVVVVVLVKRICGLR
jgi:hypothetical protein